MKLQVHIEFDPANQEEVARIQAMLRTIVASDAATLPGTRETLDAVEPPVLDLEAAESAATTAPAATPRRRGQRRAAPSTNGATASEPADLASSLDCVATEESPEPSTATEDAPAALREQLAFEWRRVATGYGVIRARDLATSIVNSGRIVPNADAVPDGALDQTVAAFQAVI